MTDWQLIETAQKNGLEIILYDGHGVFAGYWEGTPNYWNETGWQEEGGRGGMFFSRHPCKPTHWMPMPSGPPKERDNE